MFTRVSELLSYLAHESAKVPQIRICPFCGQNLNDEHLKAFKVRLGRLQFVFRVFEQTGSKKAFEFLYNFLVQPNARDIPEKADDYPEWWVKLAIELYREEGEAKRQERHREL